MSGETGTTLTVPLSVESLPKKQFFPSDSKWSRLNESVRPCSSMSGDIRLRSPSSIRRAHIPLSSSTHRIPPSSSSMQRSLPSSEFLRLASSNEQLNSPITPLSFDFGRKKRRRLRQDSPDILRRSSPDLVSRSRRSAGHREELGSPEYSGSDFAPGVERGSAESVCYGERGSDSESVCYVPGGK